ncbi:hypothetical protein T484DRAFT_2016554 [Baffinella frigidus]|nr:hypothetical protein T484DRAFT_2016554 [Cryptophyta sp. CCMP2293]
MVDGDHGEDDPAGLQLQAEPPRDNGFEAFYSERPAFLLARVDGDELAHLLDSRNGTPFDTPRDDEDGHTGVRRMHSASSRRSTGSPGKDKNARKPARWGAGFDEEFLDPGPAEQFTELSKGGGRSKSADDRAGSPGDESQAPTKRNAREALVELSDRDSRLSGDWQFFGVDAVNDKEKMWSIPQARLLYMISLYAAAAAGMPDEEERWIKILHVHVLVFEGAQLQLFDLSLVPTGLFATTAKGVSRKLYLQVAPETTTMLNEMCRTGLLNCLRVVTHGQWPTVAYQVAKDGLTFIGSMPEQLKHEMRVVTHGGKIQREIPIERRGPKKKKKKVVIKVEGEDGAEGDRSQRDKDRPETGATGASTDRTAEESAVRFEDEVAPGGLDNDDYEEVDFSHEMLEVTIDKNMRIALRTPGGYFRESSAADPPQVPYVTSPYVPHSLRRSAAPTTDNSARGYECALWPTQLADGGDEAMVLANVTVVLAEWFPVGPNVVQSLIEKLDGIGAHSGTRFRSTLSSKVDTSDRRPGGDGEYGGVVRGERLTVASLLDCKVGVDVNVEARIERDESTLPVRCVQEFGVHLDASGLVLCGVQFEGIMAREWDDMPPNLLSHAAHALQFGSSQVVADLTTKLQRDILNVLFEGEEATRPKYFVFASDALEPRLATTAEYMDGGRFQHALIELIGEIQTSKLLGKEDMLFVGADGILFAGPNTRDHDLEAVLYNYVSLMVIDLTIKKVFTRIRVLNDSLAEQYRFIQLRHADPLQMQASRDRIHAAGTSVMLLAHVIGHVIASVERWTQVENEGGLPKAMEEALRLHAFHEEVLHRAHDLDRVIKRSGFEVKSLQEIADMEDRIQLEGVYATVQHGTKHLSEAQGGTLTHTGVVKLRTEVPVRVICASLAARLAFDLVHRIHAGIVTGTGTPAWFTATFSSFNDAPWIMFGFVMAVVGMIGGGLMWYMFSRVGRAHQYMWRKVVINKAIDLKRMMAFLEHAGCISSRHTIERTKERDRKVITATFRDNNFFRWFGEPPMMTLEFDATNRFVLSAKLAWPFFSKRLNNKVSFATDSNQIKPN